MIDPNSYQSSAPLKRLAESLNATNVLNEDYAKEIFSIALSAHDDGYRAGREAERRLTVHTIARVTEAPKPDMPNLVVYVAAAVTPSSCGMFLWRRTAEEAAQALVKIAAEGDDVCILQIEIPYSEVSNDRDITNWLDKNPELWEPISND